MAPKTKPTKRRPFAWGLLIGLALLIAFIVLTVTHLGELTQFVQLLDRAQPQWLLLALGFQVTTYACAGAIWWQVAKSAGHKLRIGLLARLAIEKLSIDQLLPTAGLSGSLVVMRAMRRLGLPGPVAMAAIVIDAFTYYLSFALITLLTVIILAIYHDVTQLIIQLLGLFSLIVTGIPLFLWWLLRHRKWHPPSWLGKRKIVKDGLQAMSMVSPEQILDPAVMIITTLLHLAIFILDGNTLWAMLQVTGTSVTLPMALAALVIGSVSAAISLIPGGIGGFEVGCTTTLVLFHVPIEAALTATLLLRGLTLWLPLAPGMILARREIREES